MVQYSYGSLMSLPTGSMQDNLRRLRTDDGNAALTDQALSSKAKKSSYVFNRKARFKKHLAAAKNNCAVRSGCLKQSFLSTFYVLKWLPNYKWRSDLVNDIIAGLTVGVVLIPQALAYGALSGLNPVVGMYSSFVPPFIYAVFATSKHANVGAFAIAQLMIAHILDSDMTAAYVKSSMDTRFNQTVNRSSPEVLALVYDCKISVAMTYTFVIGLFQLALGMVKFGVISEIMSDALICGYTSGCAVLIFSTQVEHVFGIRVPGEMKSGFVSVFKIAKHIILHIKETNICALLTASLSVSLLVFIRAISDRYKKKLSVPVPGELIVLIIVGLISYFTGLQQHYQLTVVGIIPHGMPKLTTPDPSIMLDILPGAFVSAVILFAINIAVIKNLAKKNDYIIDPNQELIAFGLTNIVSGFLSATVTAVSLSRSAIQVVFGRSQLASVLASILIMMSLFFMAPLFKPLPMALLAAIVLVALRNLFAQIFELKKIWKQGMDDAVVWVATWISVLVLGIDLGLVGGLTCSTLIVLIKIYRPRWQFLGVVMGTDVYKDKAAYIVEDLDRTVVMRFCGPLLYATVDSFNNEVSTWITRLSRWQDSDPVMEQNEAISDDLGVPIEHLIPSEVATPTPAELVAEMSGVLIIDLSQVIFVDSSGVNTLVQVVDFGQKSNVEVYFASCPERVTATLQLHEDVAEKIMSRCYMSIPSIMKVVSAPL